MRILIVEDNLGLRMLYPHLLKEYGPCEIAVDGREGFEAFRLASDDGKPYDVIFMDIMMPKVDGHEALRQIRTIEEARGIPFGKGVKIIMTTAVSDIKTIMSSFDNLANGYVVKPITVEKLTKQMENMGFRKIGC